MTRVLLISGTAPPMQCGVGDYTARLAREMARYPDISVRVLTSQHADCVIPGAEVEAVMPDWRLRRLPLLWRAFRAFRPDVVHLQYPTHGYGTLLLASLVPWLAWMIGARIIRTWHEPTYWERFWNIRSLVSFVLQALPPGRFIVVRPNYAQLIDPWFANFPRPRRYDLILNASAIPRSMMGEAERLNKRAEFLGTGARLIVFFGFLYPQKGAEILFDIADPNTDRLVFVGGHDARSDYRRTLEARAAQADWEGKVVFTGFLPENMSADLLAASDAVVLPFRDGGGVWNTSIHAALLQGTFTLITSQTASGYDEEQNLFFAPIDDLAVMRQALQRHAGVRRLSMAFEDEWHRVSRQHLAVYAADLEQAS